MCPPHKLCARVQDGKPTLAYYHFVVSPIKLNRALHYIVSVMRNDL